MNECTMCFDIINLSQKSILSLGKCYISKDWPHICEDVILQLIKSTCRCMRSD